MEKIIKSMIIGTPLEAIVRKLIAKPKIEFESSPQYWEKRYLLKGNSGAGSYGRLAEFKAIVINSFVEKHKINSIVEFGCGDGSQLTLAKYPSYLGLDVSPTAIQLCKQKFSEDLTKRFETINNAGDVKAELSMSLDVIYHLVEDDIFNDYMRALFDASDRYVCVYSSNFEDEHANGAEHVRHRQFTTWVQQNASDFELISETKNPYPYDANDSNNTSLADVFFFEKKGI